MEGWESASKVFESDGPDDVSFNWLLLASMRRATSAPLRMLGSFRRTLG
jgi:hypothetical protein